MGASLTKQEGSLCDAARDGKLDVIRSCLDDGADVNCTSNTRWTPLHVAASQGQYGAVGLLLTRGAAIAAKNDDGETPLHVAALHGHLAVVRLLLEKGAAIAAKTKRGDTPLHVAPSTGQYDAADLLLEKGAAIAAKNDRGDTPLHVAARYGSLDVVRLLLEKGADVTAKNGNDETPLALAKSELHFHVALLLSSKENNNEPLAALLLVASMSMYACFTYVLYAAALLLFAIALWVVYKLFLVMLWVVYQLFLVMLGVGYQLYMGTSYLLGALLYNLYLLLLWTRADPLSPQRLFLAARDGDADAVRFRLYEGHSVNAKGEHDGTPLHVAAENGHVETARLLLDKGAVIDAKDKDGETALHVAAAHGREDAVQYLLAAKANVLATTQEGKTALQLAVDRGHVEVAAVLLEAATLTADTLLQLAACFGNSGHVDTLLGAFLPRQSPETLAMALLQAKINGRDDVLRMLRPHVAASSLQLKFTKEDVATMAYLTALTHDATNLQNELTIRAVPSSAIYSVDGTTVFTVVVILVTLLVAAVRSRRRTIGAHHQIAPATTEGPDARNRAKKLSDAIQQNNWEMTKTLLLSDDDVAVPTNNDTVAMLLDHAIEACDADLLQSVVTHLGAVRGSLASDVCHRMLLAAVTSNQPRLVKVLVQDRRVFAAVSVVSSTGTSPLHEAATRGDASIVTLLLASPTADVNATNAEASTPLMLAVAQGHCDVIRTLVAFGATRDTSLLDMAINNVDTSVLAALLAAPNMDLEQLDGDGTSILARAVARGATSAVECLLDAGANAAVQGLGGVSLLALANQRGLRRIARLLYKALYGEPHEATDADIDRSEEQSLGHGTGGKVVRASYRKLAVAVKSPHYRNQFKQFRDEINVMRRFKSPYVLPLLAAVDVTPHKPQMILELMTDGDLMKYLDDRQANVRQDGTVMALNVAWVLVNALWDFHRQGLMHRDVKSLNIFLCGRNGIKLGDLGTVRELNDNLTTNVGTLKWRAPEVSVTGGIYDCAADMFSFGVVLDELRVLVSDANDAPWLAPLAAACKQKLATSRPTAIAIVERLGYEVRNVPAPSGLAAQLLRQNVPRHGVPIL
ncbi:TKL protein kinase [Saprolegnia diclina VS20]|uniref:TKL protein kinase n=1 Tax=Saprolegnia diclina (strain VS20) TaxID=1156394 RepID=T0PVF1_SAPDV|nr:TKL protein kinase [Saprolegnia diclina VS20]EQC24975.1 TKL protein kinase [Saprolegnia diclina VS20]|eukprot:XP_008621595.1 TKL protein kinase [Saprolegnia diclina VS20]